LLAADADALALAHKQTAALQQVMDVNRALRQLLRERNGDAPR